jgi:hypothetical protein
MQNKKEKNELLGPKKIHGKRKNEKEAFVHGRRRKKNTER